MLKEHSPWSGSPTATEQLQFKDSFGMSTAENLQLVLRSGYSEQNTNNNELIRIGEEMDAQNKCVKEE